MTPVLGLEAVTAVLGLEALSTYFPLILEVSLVEVTFLEDMGQFLLMSMRAIPYSSPSEACKCLKDRGGTVV